MTACFNSLSSLIPLLLFLNEIRCILHYTIDSPFYTTICRVYRYCESTGAASRCEVGDMVHKHATLAVAGRSRDIAETRRFFTDSNLPLTGEASILGHSLLLHDDEAPEHRGTRMACTAIRRQYRHKVSLLFSWCGLIVTSRNHCQLFSFVLLTIII